MLSFSISTGFTLYDGDSTIVISMIILSCRFMILSFGDLHQKQEGGGTFPQSFAGFAPIMSSNFPPFNTSS